MLVGLKVVGLGNSVENSLDYIDQETLDLLESGKIDISQICEEKVSYFIPRKLFISLPILSCTCTCFRSR